METILVVDDDDLVLKVVARILSAAKFSVLSANSGREALRIADTIDGVIDILISDVEMPEMRGPDLAETVQKSRPDTQIVLMSGSADGSLLMLNCGWAFIQKPFTGKQLVEIVSEVLRKPQRARGARG